MLNNTQLQASPEWVCLITLSEWYKALIPLCCENGWIDEYEGLRGKGRKVPYLVGWGTSCKSRNQNKNSIYWFLTPALLPAVNDLSHPEFWLGWESSDVQAGDRRGRVAVLLAGAAIDTRVVQWDGEHYLYFSNNPLRTKAGKTLIRYSLRFSQFWRMCNKCFT